MKKLILLTTTFFISSFVFCQFGAEHDITLSAAKPIESRSADLDGDGDLDILSASFDDNKIAWYQNDGLGSLAYKNLFPMKPMELVPFFQVI